MIETLSNYGKLNFFPPLPSDFGFEQSLTDAPMENIKLKSGTITEISGAVVNEFQTNIILSYKLDQEG